MILKGKIKVDINQASDYNLIISVKDNKDKPIPNVGVLVRSFETNESQVKFTDDLGVIYFEVPSDEDNDFFHLRFRRVGYKPQDVNHFIKQGVNHLHIKLENDGTKR